MITLTNVLEDIDGDGTEDAIDDDMDGDGLSNEKEFANGSDPRPSLHQSTTQRYFRKRNIVRI